MKLNNNNTREIIKNIADDIIKDKYLLYIDDMEYPGFYTLDIFIGIKEQFYMQVMLEKEKEYNREELKTLIKESYKKKELIWRSKNVF